MQEINLHKNAFRNSQMTQVFSAIHTKLLIWLREIFRVLSENGVDHINALCGQSAYRCPEC